MLAPVVLAINKADRFSAATLGSHTTQPRIYSLARLFITRVINDVSIAMLPYSSPNIGASLLTARQINSSDGRGHRSHG